MFEHILSCCPKALGQGQYIWCHHQVLKPIAEAISMGISSCRRAHPTTQKITKAGEQPPRTTVAKKPAEIMATVQDWQLSVDLANQPKFSRHIAITT